MLDITLNSNKIMIPNQIPMERFQMAKRSLLIALLLFSLASCKHEEAVEPVKVKAVSGVKVEQVGIQPVSWMETFSGKVIPDKEVFISPKVVGYLVDVKVKAGNRVKRGQLLAVIDSSDIKPDVEKARAGLKEIKASLREVDKALEEIEAHRKAAEANYMFAKKTYERFKRLLDADAVSKQRFDEVETKFKAAKAELEAVKAKEAQLLERKKALYAKRSQIEAQLKKAMVYLSYTYLKSPVDGVVLQKLVDRGNLVSPQTPVLKVGTYPLKVKAFIDSSFVGKLKVGDVVPVKVAGKEVQGKVVEVDRSADPVSHKFAVKVEIGSVEGVIPGSYAVVSLPIGEEETVVVPESAIYRVGALEYVFVIKDGTAHLRLVKTGKRVDGKVVVLSGLHRGEKIAVSRVNQLCDGARVEG